MPKLPPLLDLELGEIEQSDDPIVQEEINKRIDEIMKMSEGLVKIHN